MSNPLRDAFIAGVQWANDQCPVHGYPVLVKGEAQQRYPDLEPRKPSNPIEEGIRSYEYPYGRGNQGPGTGPDGERLT